MQKPALDPALQLVSVARHFGGVQAVRDVSLSVRSGERLGLIGPNGAGKTTLFNLVAGELIPDHGRIYLHGRDITRLRVKDRARLGLGRTYQISQLFLDLTVAESLFLSAFRAAGRRLGLLGHWQRHAAERDRAREVAEQVGLSAVLGTRVAELSHGQQRQLELGMGLAMRPRLMMLDEPAAGLSPAERVVISRLVEGLGREITVILIEHDVDLVLGLADQVTVLHQGQVIASGPPDRIRADERVQAVYLGAAHV